MNILVVCPDCSSEYNVSDDRVGTKFRCKVCQGVVTVVELEDSPLVQARKSKVVKEQKRAAERHQQVKQNLYQLVRVLVAPLLLAIISFGMALTLYPFPAFRETIAFLLILGGVVYSLKGRAEIADTEEEPLLRLRARKNSIVTFTILLKNFDKAWPWALLVLGGAVAAMFGLHMLI